jgi:hypothetical protein
MSAQRKQYADLIRHRELNALRRLMVGQHVPSATARSTLPGTSIAGGGAQQTVLRIDELESQMNQLLLERVSTTQNEFKPTQILPLQAVAGSAQATDALEVAEQVVIAHAAALFAQHQDASAQQILTSAIGAAGAQHDHVPTWLVLFDFYRATDQSQLFEALALDFSVRFGRSTPAWLSIPSLVPAASAKTAPSDWLSPSHLDEQAARGLLALLTKSAGPKRALVLDWRELVAVQPTAWQLLQQALTLLANEPMHCTLMGLASLEQTFTDALADSMLARLALLRCLNQPQAFEELALDYCTAFDISPPDWKSRQCQVTLHDLGLGLSNDLHSPAPLAASAASQSLELLGEVAALPSAFSHADQQADNQTEPMVVRCDRLVRCSPMATLALRQWAQTLKSRGEQVTFQSVHRVVAAYFLSQGIYEYAKVVIRKD